MVRRLMRAGRYQEARALLRDMNNAQVPTLERQLDLLIIKNMPPIVPRPLVTRVGMRLGLAGGGIMLAVTLCAGVTNVPFIAVCFMIFFVIGSILPEHIRRREASSEQIRQTLHKRHHERLKRGH